MAKAKYKKGTALWISEIGSIKTRVFDIIKQDLKNKTIDIRFGPKEIYRIKKKFLRAKRVIIYKTSSDKIICQNPDKIGQMDLKAQNVKTLRFNLQNSSLQESKAANNRWTIPQSAIDKLTPVFKLLFICIAIGVLGWATLKFATFFFESIMRSRIMDCATLIPKAPTPIGALINATIPIGAS